MSQTPSRLRDDPDLSPAMRAGLDGLRSQDVPYDVAKGYQAFVVAASAATAVGTASAAAAAAKATAASGVAGASLTAKVSLAVMVASLSVGGGIWWRAHEAPPQPPLPKNAALVTATARAPELIADAVQAPPMQAPQTEDREVAIDARGSVQANPDSNRVPSVAPAKPSAAAPSVEEETRHLAELRSIDGGDPAKVLALAEQGHARFAKGVFYQEREVFAILALRRIGRDSEARVRADAFIARFPKSPFVEALRW